MIKFIIGAIIFGLIALAIIILVIINFSYKSLRQLRQAAEEQFELHQKRKARKNDEGFINDRADQAEVEYEECRRNGMSVFEAQERAMSVLVSGVSNE